MDGRRSLHVPRLPRHEPPGIRARHPPQQGRSTRLRAARGADRAQGRREGHGPPSRAHGAGVRRVRPIPRALDIRGVQHVSPRDPLAAPEGRRGARQVRLRAGVARKKEPRVDPRDVPEGRAVPDRRRRALHDCEGNPQPAGAAPGAPLRPEGRPRPVLLLPRVPPPRPVHDRARRGASSRSFSTRSKAARSRARAACPSRCSHGCT